MDAPKTREKWSGVSTRLDKEISAKLDHLALQKKIKKSELVQIIIDDYLSGVPQRAYKTLKDELRNHIPDYKEMQSTFSHLSDDLKKYKETNDELHKYIAEQKSAESFYFREINEKIENMQERYEYLEQLIINLVQAPGQVENNSQVKIETKKRAAELVRKLFED